MKNCSKRVDCVDFGTRCVVGARNVVKMLGEPDMTSCVHLRGQETIIVMATFHIGGKYK